MKAALFFAALLTSLNTMAQVYVMPNEGGGEITLTSRPCEYRGKVYDGVKEAYTWSNQMYITGCWNVIDGNVHIVWNINERAERRVYNIKDFSRK